MESIAFSVIFGVFILVFGIFNLRGNVSFIHKQWLTEKTKKPYGRLFGLGAVLIGGALVAFGVFALLSERLQNEQLYLIGGVILVAGITVGLVMGLYAMIRYNRSIL